MVKLKYAGVKLVKDPELIPSQFRTQTFKHVLVGDDPIKMDGSTLHMAGKDYTPEGWLELRRRIDHAYFRGGYLEEVGPPKAPWEGRSSSFLTNNTMAIVSHDRGRLQNPPWWLRWLYSAVVTKEAYDNR